MLSIFSAPSSRPTAPTPIDPNSGRSVTGIRQRYPEPYVVPAFYNPTDLIKGIYSPQFYDTFRTKNTATREYAAGMQVLHKMEPCQRARLPLFADASSAYRELVIREIQTALTMTSQEKEILITKRQIILCAINHGYLTDHAVFGTQVLNFDGVDLSGISLSGLNLTEASLTGTKFSYPAKAASDILKAPVHGFADPELYSPVDPEKLIFSKEFYCTFRIENENIVDQQMGLITLQQMSVYQTAQLPLYSGQCAAYEKIVTEAILQVLSATETDDETVFIKQQIKTGVRAHWCLDFLKPIGDPDEGNYSKDISTLFQLNAASHYQERGQILLASLSLNELARLPLIAGSTLRYREVVSQAIKQILSSQDTDHETLLTKRQIIANASRSGYQAMVAITEFIEPRPNFDCVNFSGLKLDGLDLSNASLKNANFTDVDLRWNNLPQMGKFNACFNGAKIRGKNLIDMTAPGQVLDLTGADLSGQYLVEINFSGIILRGANLSRANLSSANLQGIDMEGANLTDANFVRADLRGASLARAQLRGANFERACLIEVNFIGADLSLAIQNEEAIVTAIQARQTVVREELNPVHAVRSIRQKVATLNPPFPARNNTVIEQNRQPTAPARHSWFSRLSSSVGNFFRGLLVRFKNFWGF